MNYRKAPKKVAKIRIAGQDRRGIISAITGFLSENNCNIEDIDQRILEGYLIMNMIVDHSLLKSPLEGFIACLHERAQSVGTEAQFKPVESRSIKNVALLVSKEDHCALDLLEKMKQGKIKGQPAIIIGNHPDLESPLKKYKADFHHIPSDNRRQHEEKVLGLLKKYNVDLIVLARYMQILSPEFVFRYEGQIINIHPSLLPAFPGPRSYHQAFNKGVEIAGVTAHFVTTDLDEGPIIAQESFRIDKTRDTPEDIIRKGRALEAKALTRAVKLFLDDRLSLRRGKVMDNKKMNALTRKAKEFYSPSL